ncbi:MULTISPECIES: LytTR family DNA-binding domain-containing protein [Hydrogenophaga]|uniref:Response regulator receiver protein n=1 Tax=Hydrogenophaga intermedia TaxID=65786 RepID=A0A1L1PC45_HYDIT|nr:MULTISPECIES: LytTR family DNA-binding domain-containing protein [Hydrogenophaga]AOS77710.1 LytTR family transcriptional regulator [Hydrogenophaga sp. PBC]TMU75861.1 LytTR family transcriptional regulator [Hydrogenophaga intermedia]CDN86374.1 Response regulator receiver protein [Hydrogenophaga intermedia]
MPTNPIAWLRQHPRWHRTAEVVFWVLVIGVHALLNTAVARADMREAGLPWGWWEAAVWEGTSHAMLLALIPGIAWWNRRFPLHWDTLARHLPWHLLGSVLFSLAHVAGMVALRHALHAAAGQAYGFGPWWSEWGYEYLKDVRAYAAIVGALTVYRLLLLRLQGEARVLDAPEPPLTAATPVPADVVPVSAPAEPPPPPRPERFLVRQLRKEFLIAANDIDWVQAQANYVGLRVNGHDYLLRSTLAEFARQLDPARFVQVHRSYLVNLERIAEIEPLDSGDARLLLRGGGTVPCSRRHRAALEAAITGSSASATSIA